MPSDPPTLGVLAREIPMTDEQEARRQDEAKLAGWTRSELERTALLKCWEVERTSGFGDLATLASTVCSAALDLAEHRPHSTHHVNALHRAADFIVQQAKAARDWRCGARRSHGICDTLNDRESETCEECGSAAPAAALASPRVEPATSDDEPAECDLAEGETFTNEDAAALGLHVQNWWKHRAAPRVETEGDVARKETHYGKDCPVGMVQVEFVGCPPEARYSKYGWKPVESAFLEVYVDGQRYHINVGTFHDGRAERRGLHIVGPIDLAVEQTSMNAASLFRSRPPVDPKAGA